MKKHPEEKPVLDYGSDAEKESPVWSVVLGIFTAAGFMLGHLMFAAHGRHWNNLAWIPATLCFKANMGLSGLFMLWVGSFVAGVSSATMIWSLRKPRNRPRRVLLFLPLAIAMYVGFPVPSGLGFDTVLLHFGDGSNAANRKSFALSSGAPREM